MDNICFCKIPLENSPGESIPVYSTWADKSFSVNLYHKDRAWHKSVSGDDLKLLSGFTRNSVDEYLCETKRALSSDGGCPEFTYVFVESELIWKKIVDRDNGIKIKFGSLRLEEMPVASFAETVVDFLLNRCLTFEATNNVMKKENDDLRAANTALRTHVCSISKLKTEMEESFYTKALVVLNAKKEKICELQELIETRPTTSGTSLDSGLKTENVEKGFSPSKLSDLYGSETEIDSDNSRDLDYTTNSSTLSPRTIAKVKEEEEDSMPTASKSLKLDNISSKCLAKSPAENEVDDVGDIFVPARRKKNMSRTCH